MPAALASTPEVKPTSPSARIAAHAERFADTHGIIRHLSVAECVHLSGFSRASIYRALNRGDLVGVRCGIRCLVPVENLRKYLAGLPRAKFGKEALRANRDAA